MKALLDSNILIDYLNGIVDAKVEIERYTSPMISAISWMEVMAGASRDEEGVVRRFLSRFIQVPVDHQVAELAVEIRRRTRIRLPEAIIWASAQSEEALLVSRNSRDFPEDDPGVRIPYSV